MTEYRATAPELTDEVLAQAINKQYPDLFLDAIQVVPDVVAENFRDELPLDIENFMDTLQYMIEERELLSFLKCTQHIYSTEAQQLRQTADQTIEKIYKAACLGQCRLTELASSDVIQYFSDTYKHREGMKLSAKLNNLLCNYHCRIHNLVSCYPDNFPPFTALDDNGDVVFVPSTGKSKDYKTIRQNYRESKQSTPNTSLKQPQQPAKQGCLLLLTIPIAILWMLI